MVTLANRAKVNTSTTGTGTISLGTVVAGYQSFSAAGVANGNVVRYVIEDGAEWEIGTGTYTSTGSTLTRTVSESSNAGAAISLTGDATVFVGLAASDIVQTSDIGVTVQAYDASIVSDGAYVHTDNNYTTAEKSKLAGVEAGATADQTAAEILTAIKTVDGAASGLDADLLDGQHGSYYYSPANAPDPVVTLAGAVTGAGTLTNLGNVTITTTATSDPTLTLAGDVTGTATFTNLGNATLTAVVADDSHNHIISNVDGLQTALNGKLSTTGKAADSNLLDGLDSTAFYLASNPSGYTTNIGDITGVTAGSGITGGGTSGTVTINHADTSTQTSVNNANATVIQDVTLDTYGHVTGLASKTITAADVGAITGNQTITLSGDATGSGTTSIVVTVADDSHNHIISNVDGLQAALDGKSPTSHLHTGVYEPADATILKDADIGVTVQGYSAILAGTTASYTTAEKTKLAGIEAGATADQTASEILTAIKTVDGAASGLDADLLDGLHASSFLQGNQTITLSGDLTGSGTTSINAQLAANVVNANELNVVGNGTTAQYLRSDGDGSFTWSTPTDTNTTYSAGTNMSLAGTVFSVAASPTFATADINGGTIDGTVIGGTTPAAITGTTLTATGAFTSKGIDDNATSKAMTLDSSGNVGIGTTVFSYPSAGRGLVEVNGSSSALIALKVGNASKSYWFCDGFNTEFLANGGELRFGAGLGGAVRMKIDSSGRIDMGSNVGSIAGVSMYPDYSAGTALLYWNRNTTGSTGTALRFDDGGFQKGGITYTSSATAFNTTSDYRLKENVTPIQGAADIVKMMRPCTYTFKSDDSWADGFLAHELQELHPRAVIGSKDAMVDEEYEVTPAVYEDVIIPAVDAVVDEDGNVTQEAQPERTEQRFVTEAVMGTRSVPDYQQVDYSKLTPILTAALQEALNKIDALEARLTALEAV